MPHFTVANNMILDIGRNRHLSYGSVGRPNEMIFICEAAENDSNSITDLVCIHNYDHDGYMTMERLKMIIQGIAPNIESPKQE